MLCDFYPRVCIRTFYVPGYPPCTDLAAMPCHAMPRVENVCTQDATATSPSIYLRQRTPHASQGRKIRRPKPNGLPHASTATRFASG